MNAAPKPALGGGPALPRVGIDVPNTTTLATGLNVADNVGEGVSVNEGAGLAVLVPVAAGVMTATAVSVALSVG